MGFGTSETTDRSRVPRPPARITASTAVSRNRRGLASARRRQHLVQVLYLAPNVPWVVAYEESPVMGDIGIDIRAGLHLGECEVMEDGVRGITVHIGARVTSKAQPGEILVSSTLKEAVAGSEFRFESRGSHRLKGIPGEWSLFAVNR